MNYSGYPSFVNHCDETETTSTEGGFPMPFLANKNAPWVGAGVIDSLIFNFLLVQIYP
jgi:hypothetical protein